MSITIKVTVRHTEHANMDSLPLRFGLHYLTDTEVELSECEDRGIDYRDKARHHYDGYLRDPQKPLSKGLFGHFIVVDSQSTGRWTLITAWRDGDSDAEFFLSQTLRNLREDGTLNPETLLRMHPLYLKGEVNSSAALVKFLAKDMAKDDIARLVESEKRSRIETEKVLAEISRAKQDTLEANAREAMAKSVAYEAIEAVEGLEKITASLEQDNQAKDEEIRLLKERETKRYAQEETQAQAQQSTATLSTLDTLVRVDENVSHRGSNCTVITLGDGSKRYLKKVTFDPSGVVTARVKSMLHKRVRTTCWDPIQEPGKWSRQGYFRNIYQLD